MVSAKLALGALFFSLSLAQTDELSLSSVWRWRNYGNAKPVSPVGQDVTIHVPPDTDIWRPAKALDNFTAPFLYTTVPTANFVSIQVTVTAPWKTLYDQGGLVVAYPSKHPREARFIKAGIEFTDGAAAIGVVATDILSDWSLSPIVERQSGNAKVTILIERQDTDAWVYVLENNGKTRRQLRQVTWAFNKDDGQGLAREISVGIYGAKPTRESPPTDPFSTISVTFSNFELKVSK